VKPACGAGTAVITAIDAQFEARRFTAAMPIYEYVCEKCGKLNEVMQKVDDPAPKCDACGSRKLRRIMSRSSFQLKGGGWYSDLYGNSKTKSSGEGTATSASSSSTTSSSDTRSETKSSEAKPGNTKPAEAKSSEVKAAATKPAASKAKKSGAG
jgi:putative FmdB family regulatory protein